MDTVFISTFNQFDRIRDDLVERGSPLPFIRQTSILMHTIWICEFDDIQWSHTGKIELTTMITTMLTISEVQKFTIIHGIDCKSPPFYIFVCCHSDKHIEQHIEFYIRKCKYFFSCKAHLKSSLICSFADDFHLFNLLFIVLCLSFTCAPMCECIDARSTNFSELFLFSVDTQNKLNGRKIQIEKKNYTETKRKHTHKNW